MDTCQIKVCGVNQLVTDGGNLSFTFIHSFPRCQSWVGIFEESFTSVWKLGECISIKIKSWIAESDFSFRDARVPRGKPSTRLQALVGENQNLTKTSMLLLRNRNQRITIVSTLLSPLSCSRNWSIARKQTFCRIYSGSHPCNIMLSGALLSHCEQYGQDN